MTSRRLVGLLLGVLGLLVLPAAPALAHTEQVSVSPAPGSSTTGSVPAVEIDFSDEVLPGLARVVVRDARGRDHVAGRVAVLGGRVSARLDDMGPGRYRVRVAAAPTGDVTAGTATSAPGAPTPPVEAAAAGRSAGARNWGFPALLVGVVVLSGAARWRVARRRVLRP